MRKALSTLMVVLTCSCSATYPPPTYYPVAPPEPQSTAPQQVANLPLQRPWAPALYGVSPRVVQTSRVPIYPTNVYQPGTATYRPANVYAPTYAPGCAENGSCYGDISSRTGRPKTVAVGGYYRKDGTYVRGHYRSR